MIIILLIFCMNMLYWIMKSYIIIICSQKKSITYNLLTLHKPYSSGKPSLIPISRSSNKREPMLWKVLLREFLKFSAQTLIATAWSNSSRLEVLFWGFIKFTNHRPTAQRPTDPLSNQTPTHRLNNHGSSDKIIFKWFDNREILRYTNTTGKMLSIWIGWMSL